LLAEVYCSWGLNCLGWGTGKVNFHGSEFFSFNSGLLHLSFPQYKDMTIKVKIKNYVIPLVIRHKEGIEKGFLSDEDCSRLALNFEESMVFLAVSAWLSGINTH
jgi:hypothetical protein